jgi:PIF1-like helicase
VCLHIHLENCEYTTFTTDSLTNVISNGPVRTMLTAWMELNNEHGRENETNMILYPDMPRYFTWNQKDKKWKTRARGESKTIGRIVSLSPSSGDIFYLRMLLYHESTAGAKSWEDLMLFDGEICTNFKGKCILMGILENDNEIELALNEATSTHMPDALISFFCQVLLFCEPVEPKKLYDTFKYSMSEGYRYYIRELSVSDDVIYDKLLSVIEDQLRVSGRELSEFRLGYYNPSNVCFYNELRESTGRSYSKEAQYSKEELEDYYTSREPLLNDEQGLIYNSVHDTMIREEHLLFFIDAKGGTGKTFLLNTIIASKMSKGYKIVATAASGVAATMLLFGRTTHSQFKLPLQISSTTMCNINCQSSLAKFLRDVNLVIIDEVTLLHKHVLETINRTLQDITKKKLPFGGLNVILSGDFRQVLPIIRHGDRATVVDACISRSQLWKNFTVKKLDKNMRLENLSSNSANILYNKWLDQLGEGLVADANDMVQVPENLSLGYDINEIISYIYPNIEHNYLKISWLMDRAILSPLNVTVNKLNTIILNLRPGPMITLYSADKMDEESSLEIPVEYLQDISIPSLPEHLLRIKEHCIVILMRNLAPGKKLCNGTRLIFNRMVGRNVIECTNCLTGKRVLIPKIKLKANIGA